MKQLCEPVKLLKKNIDVAGSIGPLNLRLEPWGPLSEEEAREIFVEQAQGLIDGGVDLIILETFSDLHLVRGAYYWKKRGKI